MPDQTTDYYGSESPAETPEGQDENTFLAPKSAFGEDCKVGDTKKVKVVAAYDDEVELAYVKSEDKKDDKSDEGMSGAEKRMDQMMEA